MPLRTKTTRPVGPLPPVAIVVSRYNASVTDRLLAGAVRAYVRSSGRVQDLYIAEAPGAFELVSMASAAAASGAFHGVLAIGCIVKGETRHDEFLAHAVTQGLAIISATPQAHGRVVPVGLAVLTVNTPAQAAARAGGKLGNKGEEAMLAVLQTIGETAALSDAKTLRRVMATGELVGRLMDGAPLGESDRPDKIARPVARPVARTRPARAQRRGRA
jgi:6,7-dimethyl-8-ribityllumazine synthase